LSILQKLHDNQVAMCGRTCACTVLHVLVAFYLSSLVSDAKNVTCGQGIWSTPMGNAGACNPCNPPPMTPSDIADWTCSGNGDIELDLSGTDAQRCMSFSTAESCTWKQKDMVAVQAQLDSSNCNGLWVAPLWIVGTKWISPQSSTGEIDMFERGCYANDGYLLSLGSEEDTVMQKAWQEQGKPKISSSFTGFFTLDRASDVLTAYRCPSGSNPISDGTSACIKTQTNSGYFARTAGETNNGEEYFHFVSDVWNACGSMNCQKHPPSSSQCHFKVSNIKMRLASGASMRGSGAGGVCNALLADDVSGTPESRKEDVHV